MSGNEATVCISESQGLPQFRRSGLPFDLSEMRDPVACKEVIGVSTKPKGYVLEDRDADCWPVGGILPHRLDL
jgi:hypothetical protein